MGKRTEKPSPAKNKPIERNIKCTRVIYRVTNNDIPEKGGLVDRGAHGGLAGRDLRIISTTDRWVDITGINDIRIDNIRIGTVGGVVKTQKGPVIAIFHQHALGDHGNSIHSSGQMEYYRNCIDDRSMKVGGTQSITTIDGYVLPLDIINGLPHMMARPFSDREWDDYPHVVMTSDGDWNPTVLDNIISNKPNWYAEIDPKSNDTVNNPFNEVGEYMEGHREDPFVYARTGTVDHIEIPWQLCSSQLRHLHKEYVAVEAEKVLCLIETRALQRA
jgi:hypothetical protein